MSFPVKYIFTVKMCSRESRTFLVELLSSSQISFSVSTLLESRWNAINVLKTSLFNFNFALSFETLLPPSEGFV